MGIFMQYASNSLLRTLLSIHCEKDQDDEHRLLLKAYPSSSWCFITRAGLLRVTYRQEEAKQQLGEAVLSGLQQAPCQMLRLKLDEQSTFSVSEGINHICRCVQK